MLGGEVRRAGLGRGHRDQLAAIGLGALIGDAPAMRPGAQRAMDAWGLLGGYHLERLPVVHALDPIDDPEALVLGLVTIRDTLSERAE